jgi:hypothetical protein
LHQSHETGRKEQQASDGRHSERNQPNGSQHHADAPRNMRVRVREEPNPARAMALHHPLVADKAPDGQQQREEMQRSPHRRPCHLVASHGVVARNPTLLYFFETLV